MSDPLAHYIPRRLDDPPRFLLWRWDVALVGVFIFLIGIWFGWTITGLVVALAAATALNKVVEGTHPGISTHLAFWHFGTPKLKTAPPSSVREFIG